MHIIKQLLAVTRRFSFSFFSSFYWFLFSLSIFSFSFSHTHKRIHSIAPLFWRISRWKQHPFSVESGPNQFIIFICWRKICKRIHVFHVLARFRFQVYEWHFNPDQRKYKFPVDFFLSLFFFFASFCRWVSLPKTVCATSVVQSTLVLAFIWEIRKSLFECGLMQTHTLSIRKDNSIHWKQYRNLQTGSENLPNAKMKWSKSTACTREPSKCLAIYQFQTNKRTNERSKQKAARKKTEQHRTQIQI